MNLNKNLIKRIKIEWNIKKSYKMGTTTSLFSKKYNYFKRLTKLNIGLFNYGGVNWGRRWLIFKAIKDTSESVWT